MAKISVIIPNYNRATIVSETIENMLLQSLAPDEILVVDDLQTTFIIKEQVCQELLRIQKY